jgi:ABC-2 type transport system ATP-binding protein
MPDRFVVRADDLHKTYKPDVKALDGLSLAVAAGGVFALLGPNGAGKTTTVRILTTLAKPDRGSVEVAGLDAIKHPGEVRSIIGAVSQHTGTVETLTGEENLAMQGRLYGMRGRELRRRVADLLDVFGLTAAARRQAKTYSGGMRRRLDIATVLVHRPAVLFLDEPTTGLDPEGRADLWAVLTGLAADVGTTIVLTTHYLEEADQYAQTIAIVDAGRVVAQGTAEQLKSGLHGDSVLFEAEDAGQAGKLAAALADLPQVRDASADGALTRARVGDGPRALPGLLARVEAAGLPVVSVTVARPSLDDVYLHHAGRTFRQAERTAA